MSEARANYRPLVRPGEIEHHVADMTATFSADVTLEAAQAKLAQAGQWLPIDGDPNQTLGRLVETNSTGPLRLGFGAWRDLLLGAQLLNGRDELITAGGRVMKNVAGYDLTKLVVGAGGAFGKLVTVTTRTYKRPAGAVVAKMEEEKGSRPSYSPLVNRLMPTDLRPQWMILTASEMWCGYVGDERTVEWVESKLAELKPTSVQRRTIEEDIAHRRELWNIKGERTFRAALPPAKVKEFVKAASLTKWVADPVFGVVLGEWSADAKARIIEASKRASGVVTFFENDVMDFQPADEAQRKLLERLKLAFDPEGRLA